MSNKGYTLVEVLLASFFTALLVVGGWTFWSFVTQSTQFSLEESQLIENSQINMNILIAELRRAFDGEDGAYPLLIVNDTEIVFFADINNDLKTERVHYWYSNGQLLRGVVLPVGVPATYPLASESIRIVADGLVSNGEPIFYYYNGNWPGDDVNNPLIQSARLLNTRFISVQITMDVFEQFGAEPITIQSSTQLRNLKDNL